MEKGLGSGRVMRFIYRPIVGCLVFALLPSRKLHIISCYTGETRRVYNNIRHDNKWYIMIIMCITVAAAIESRCSRRRDVHNTTVELNDYTLTYYNVSKSRPSGKNHVRYRFSGYYDLRPGRRSVQHPAGRCAI